MATLFNPAASHVANYIYPQQRILQVSDFSNRGAHKAKSSTSEIKKAILDQRSRSNQETQYDVVGSRASSSRRTHWFPMKR